MSTRNDSKRFVMTFDPADSAHHIVGDNPAVTKQNIDALFRLWKWQGVDTVLYRVSECGRLGYPTKIGSVWSAVQTGIDKIHPGYKMLDVLLAQLDPLAEAVKAARNHGIEILVWVTLYDSYYEVNGQPGYGYWGWFEQENYETLGVLSRQGKKLRGVMEFHYPAVREYWLKVMRELASYKVDGIYICVKTHSWCQIREQGSLYGESEFGFNEPVAVLYKERYGMDPRHAPYDKTRLSAILGEGLTAFLRENRRVWGRRVVFIGKAPITLIGLQAFPQYPIFLDLSTWSNERLIDRISVGYDIEWRKYGDSFADEVAAQIVPKAGQNVEVYVNVLSRLDDANFSDPAEFRRHVLALNNSIAANPNLAGGCYHEHEGFYGIYGENMNALWPEFAMFR